MITKITTKKPPRIFFDASVSIFGVVGIGIYECQSNEKATISVQTTTPMSSTDAEELAFKKAIQFGLTNFNSTTFNFFTDNRGVYLKYRDVLAQYRKDGFEFALNWIPREMNCDADRLSKLASNRGSVTGSNSVEKQIEKEMMGTPISEGLTSYIRSKSLNEKFNLMKKVFINDVEKDAFESLFNNKGNPPKVTKTSKTHLTHLAKFISNTFYAKEKKMYPRVKHFLEYFKQGAGTSRQVPGYKDKDLEKLIRNRTKIGMTNAN